MNKVIFAGGGKGGVGKTMVTIAVVDALLARGESVVLVESDDSNPDAYKALNKLVPCSLLNLDSEDGYLNLCNLIESNPDACIVVNTAARATDSIIKHGGILGDTAKELNRELVMLWPINRQRDSVELLKNLLDGVGDIFSATYTVINTYWGAPEKFMRYNNSKQKERVTGTVVFPELNDLVSDKMNDNRLALSNAAEGMTIAERSVLSRFRHAAHEALNGVL